MQQRFRPLGLSLAILATFLMFGFLPLVPALFIVLLRLQGRTLEPVYPTFWLPPILGVIVIILCVFAWAGRPPRVRLTFLIALLFSALVNGYGALRPDQLKLVSELSGGSLDSVFRGLTLCLLPMQILVFVYTVWYINRAPARAFFDG